MTHHNDDKHHAHQHEREREKKLEKEREEREMEQPRTIHPGWFLGIGIALIVGVLIVWVVLW